MFQSAPRSRERDDFGTVDQLVTRRRFNPRPALASGTTPHRCGRLLVAACFNPRPALASGTTYADQAACGAVEFQSAPRSRERDDEARPQVGAGVVVSIRAPLSRAGRHCEHYTAPTPSDVSIRAPLSRAGRPYQIPAVQGLVRFQSAPRSRERDDCALQCSRLGLLVSIRAPLSRAGRRPVGADQRSRSGFNPRPALASGTTRQSGVSVAGHTVSIRAPLSRAGRRSARGLAARGPSVSIRAPLSRAGRQLLTAIDESIALFQSAPRSRERDDAFDLPFLIKRSCFNPRPALASGTTSLS